MGWPTSRNSVYAARMRRRTLSVVALALLLGAGVAAAKKLEVGDAIFVRARDTRVFKDEKARAVVKTLQVGDAVKWQGTSAQDKRYHQVALDNGKSGFIWYQNLSTTAPQKEVVFDKSSGSGKNLTTQAFASVGAASRGLTPGAQAVSKTKDDGRSARELLALEQVAKAITPSDLDAHRKQAGLQETGR